MTEENRAVASTNLVRPFDGVEIEDRGNEYWVFVERRIRAAMLGNHPPAPDPEGSGIEEHLLKLRAARREESGSCEIKLFVVPDGSLPGPNCLLGNVKLRTV